ncbi:MAG: hypothetical protein JXA42_18800 [Anaerolineales bacterium]|nr:hypothetical protein [Anaerolineales bacterium]
MEQEKVLKIRMGHEANCSSGMVFTMILMGGGVTLLPASIIIGAIHAAKLGNGKKPGRRWLYWFIPLLLGLVFSVYSAYINQTSGYSDAFFTPLVIGIGLLFIFLSFFSYSRSPRMKRPWWLVLQLPLLLIVGTCLMLSLAYLSLLYIIPIFL